MGCCCRSRSFKVILIGTNRKPICNFLLFFHCNYAYLLSFPSWPAFLPTCRSDRSRAWTLLRGWFLPRDAVHKRSLRRRAVSVRVLVYSVKRVNIFSNFFTSWYTHHSVYIAFAYQTLSGAKIAIFDQYLALGSMTGGVSSVVNNFDGRMSL